MAVATSSWGLMRFAFLPCSLVVMIMFLNLKSTTVTAHSPAHADRDRLSLLKTQASILIALKQTFQSHHPSLLSAWNLPNYSLLCSWTGVRCDPATNSSVVSLDLSSFNISGSLSPLISDLPALLNLSLSGNSFSGDFPPAIIHKLSSLQFLNISDNQFTGVPAQWDLSRLKELRVLDAYDNCFNGSLPLPVTQLPKLTHLDFGGNYFTGTIPPAYGSMKTEQLTYLSLKGNDLRGSIPAELGNLTSLRQLYLGYYNEFEGGIPPEFGKLVNLVHLDLANCGLKGPIPPELGNLNMLDTLFLQTNELTGSIPPALGNLTSVNSLDLSNNALAGGIPLEFSSLRQLTLLNLFLNRLHGEIPHFIAELPHLQVLKLWHNNFTGTIPGELGQNGKLVELDLSSNKLTGLVPKSLCWGRRLQILILRINFLFGPLPEDLGLCHTLVRVRMGQNYLTGPIPAGFLYLPRLSLMELQDNHLSGSLPEEQRTSDLPCCSKLEELNLSDNRLSGPLPASSIGNFSKLQSLLLSGNQFTSGIPSEVGQLRNVLTLDVSRNNLSGTIPPEIGNCPVLTYLDLSANQLSGPIPLEITQIHILNYLNLSWNRLNQSLPKEIGSMKSLTSADFSHNNFSGMVPEFGQYTFFNSTSFVGNPLLCGFYVNPCNSSSSSSMSPLQLHNQSGSGSSSRSLLQVAGKLKLVAAVGLGGCMLVFVGLAIAKAWKMRRNMRYYSWRMTGFQKLEFGSEDIVECVKESNIIGRGGAGIVYRGLMPSGEQVAVKKLLGISGGKGGGSSSHRHRHHHHDDKGLSAEIQILGRIRHRNIVRLLAFCSNRETNLLVYEYMPNGSLGEALHGKINGNGIKGGGGGGLLLHWDTRLKIAIEAAKGLAYLHHDCSPLIIHRDVKSNNILLNSEFEAHVADFGLAKFWQEQDAAGTSEYMSAIAGSYGYIAPEYAYTLKVDEKSDVYSFGVVLLELITGRRPVGDFGEEGLDIVQWAKLQTNSNRAGVAKILDHRLTTEGDVPLHEAMQVFFVAMLCVDEHSVQRPTMREVVQMLSQAKQPNTFKMH